MQYNIVIVGAGISGATLAERYANVLNKKVLVIEKRDHMGGNCYDYYDKAGILVPKYGPHLFHTNYQDVWNYINKFSQWIPYKHKVLSNVDGKNKLVPVPVNIKTVNLLLGTNIKNEKQMKQWLNTNTVKIKNPKNSEEVALSRVGKKLYELMFKNYTKKQWGMWPKQLGPEVLSRIPIRINFDDHYFSDKFQAMPKEGYTKLFEKMLSHRNIKVILKTDYLKIKNKFKNYEKLFFTGPIDQFFQYKLGGKLQYRSMQFKHETFNQEYFQSAIVINYPNTEKFTRITEPKHATGQVSSKTTIIREYSTWKGDPYYPVPSKKNQKTYVLYQKEAKKLEKNGIYFVGRLANYKYYNMDQAFKNALDLFLNLYHR